MSARSRPPAGRSLVQYRGQLMPLIPVTANVHIKSTGLSSRSWCSPNEGRSMALMGRRDRRQSSSKEAGHRAGQPTARRAGARR